MNEFKRLFLWNWGILSFIFIGGSLTAAFTEVGFAILLTASYIFTMFIFPAILAFFFAIAYKIFFSSARKVGEILNSGESDGFDFNDFISMMTPDKRRSSSSVKPFILGTILGFGASKISKKL